MFLLYSNTNDFSSDGCQSHGYHVIPKINVPLHKSSNCARPTSLVHTAFSRRKILDFLICDYLAREVRMRSLPQPPQNFLQKKAKILEQLSIPDSEYTDASPKGSVDAGIRDLIDELNELPGFVTTSSCAGRVSVFVEGRKTAEIGGQTSSEELAEPSQDESARTATVAGVGGKGGGGNWLFVSHDPVKVEDGQDLRDVFGINGKEEAHESTTSREDSSRLIHFKFEPMVS